MDNTALLDKIKKYERLKGDSLDGWQECTEEKHKSMYEAYNLAYGMIISDLRDLEEYIPEVQDYQECHPELLKDAYCAVYKAPSHSVKDVEGLADSTCRGIGFPDEEHRQTVIKGFIEGYKAAQSSPIEETKKWSNEDIKAAWQAGVNSMIDGVDIEEVQYLCFEDFIQSPKGEDKTQTVKETAEQFFDRFFHTSTPNRNFIIRKMEEYANQFK